MVRVPPAASVQPQNQPQRPSSPDRRRPARFRHRVWKTWREKRKAIKYYDSLVGKVDLKLDATSRECKANFFSVQRWITKKGRAKIEEKCKEGDVTNKGGRGKKGAGNFKRTLVGRRRAKYDEAEAETVVWCKAQRAVGKRLRTKAVKKKMIECWSDHDEEVARYVTTTLQLPPATRIHLYSNTTPTYL